MSLAASWAEEELERLSAASLRRRLEPRSSPQGPVIELDGRPLINFSSNDYLGFSNEPRIIAAASAALLKHGIGAGASRLVVGDSEAHQALEGRLATFMDAPAVLLFGSGYAANVGALSALVGDGDALFSDALNHASIIDGTRLSTARTVVYPHVDLTALDRLLASTKARRKLVCTDAVFSMDGDVAPLASLVELCGKHAAALLVDEAHAIGVLGERGAGLCEALGLCGAVDLRVGTLSKALGSYGAFVACSTEVRELLINKARSLVFSTALPGFLCAAAVAAVDLVEHESAIRQRLWRNIGRLSEGLSARPSSAVFPVVLGEAARALWVASALRERGLLVKPMRPPTVPRGTSRLRIAVSAGHTVEHIDALVTALKELDVV